MANTNENLLQGSSELSTTDQVSVAKIACPRSSEWAELLAEVGGDENELHRRLEVKPRASAVDAARIALLGRRLRELYASGITKTQAAARLGISPKQRRTAERAWERFSGASVAAPDPYKSRRLNEFDRTLAAAQASGWADRQRAAHARARAKVLRAAGRVEPAGRCSRLAERLEQRATGPVTIARHESEAVIELLALEARFISKTDFHGIRLDANVGEQARSLLATWGEEPSPDSPWLAIAYRTIAELVNSSSREAPNQGLRVIAERTRDGADRADHNDISSVDAEVLGPDVRPDRNGAPRTSGWLGWNDSEHLVTGSDGARVKWLLDRRANEKNPGKRVVIEAQLDSFAPGWRDQHDHGTSHSITRTRADELAKVLDAGRRLISNPDLPAGLRESIVWATSEIEDHMREPEAA